MSRNLRLWLGIALTGVLVAVALLSLVWTPESPTRLRIPMKLQAPFGAAPLGTDQLGRDLLSMLMAGAWNSLSIAIASVALGLAGGVLVGASAAAARGVGNEVGDEAAMRLMDVVFAFPAVLSAVMIAALMGPGPVTAIIAIGVFNVPVFARLSRGAALQILARDYVAASRAAGRGPLWILLRHVLPNIAGLLVVQVAIQLALAVLTEAGLSFLGVGVPPPAPSWGRMLSDSQTYLAQAPWLAILPGAAIALGVLGFNLLGDGLRDAVDPKLRRRR